MCVYYHCLAEEINQDQTYQPYMARDFEKLSSNIIPYPDFPQKPF